MLVQGNETARGTRGLVKEPLPKSSHGRPHCASIAHKGRGQVQKERLL